MIYIILDEGCDSEKIYEKCLASHEIIWVIISKKLTYMGFVNVLMQVVKHDIALTRNFIYVTKPNASLLVFVRFRNR